MHIISSSLLLRKINTVFLGNVVSTPPRPLREDQPTRRSCSIDEFIQRGNFGDSGQVFNTLIGEFFLLKFGRFCTQIIPLK